MNFLILGCNGMAGHMISLYLQEQGHNVTGFARKDLGLIPTIVGDANDLSVINHLLENNSLDYVVNCLGVLNQNADKNKTEAIYVNSYLPHYIDDFIKVGNTKLIHLSTDCVFSGIKGQYTINDIPDAHSFYGLTKTIGEVDDSKSLTIRTSIIGPDLNNRGIGLFNWFMQQDSCVYGYAQAIWTGITTLELAKFINFASQIELNGLIHLVPNESISKYNLLQLLNTIRKDRIEIIKDEKVVVDKSLIPDYPNSCYRVPDYIDMIYELVTWMEKHPRLYSHYSMEMRSRK